MITNQVFYYAAQSKPMPYFPAEYPTTICARQAPETLSKLSCWLGFLIQPRARADLCAGRPRQQGEAGAVLPTLPAAGDGGELLISAGRVSRLEINKRNL